MLKFLIPLWAIIYTFSLIPPVDLPLKMFSFQPPNVVIAQTSTHVLAEQTTPRVRPQEHKKRVLRRAWLHEQAEQSPLPASAAISIASTPSLVSLVSCDKVSGECAVVHPTLIPAVTFDPSPTSSPEPTVQPTPTPALSTGSPIPHPTPDPGSACPPYPVVCKDCNHLDVCLLEERT